MGSVRKPLVAVAAVLAALVSLSVLEVASTTPAFAGVVDTQIKLVAKSVGAEALTSFSPATTSSRGFIKGKLNLAKAQVSTSGCGDALTLIQVVENAITNPSATVRIIGPFAATLLPQLVTLEARIRGAQSSQTCGTPTGGSTNPSTVMTALRSSDQGHATFSLLLPAVQVGPSSSPDSSQQFLSVSEPGAGRAAGAHLGQPDLPAVSLLVAVPQGTRPHVSITGSSGYSMTLPYPVAPLEASQPASLSTSASTSSLPTDTVPWVQDSQAYQGDAPFPALVADPLAFSQRDLRLVSVSVPVARFTPATSQLNVLTSATVVVTFCDPSYQNCVPNGTNPTGGEATIAAAFGDSSLIDSSNAAFVNLWQSTVTNWSQVASSRLADSVVRPRCGEQMMLITVPSWSLDADSYAADRTAHGVLTKVFSTSDIGATTTAIHTAISNEMTANCATKPSFVLLFGPTNGIPTFEVALPQSYNETGDLSAPNGGAVASDQPYGFIHQWGSFDPSLPGSPNQSGRTTVDLTPDLFVGRITQPINGLRFLLDYIDSPPKDPSLYKAVTGAQFFQRNPDGCDQALWDFVQDSEFVGNLAAAAGKTFKAVSTKDACDGPDPARYKDGSPLPKRLLQPGAWSGTTSDISAAANAGSSIIWHSDHGFSDGGGWADPKLDVNDLNLLSGPTTAYGLRPVLWSSDCDTGKYDFGGGQRGVVQTGYNFGERAINFGFVAHVGASRESPIYEDGVLLQSMGRALFPEVGNLWKALLLIAPSKPVTQMGALLEAAKLDVNRIASQSWGAPLVDLEFNLAGDPSMSIQRDAPKIVNKSKFSVNAIASATSGAKRVAVSTGTAKLPKNSTLVVQAVKDGVLLASAYLDPTTHSAVLTYDSGGADAFNGATFTLVGSGLVPLTKVVSGL